MVNRRSFLGSILALGVAPAIVRADSLMRIVPRDALVIIDEASLSLTKVSALVQITEELLQSTIGIGGPFRTMQDWENAAPAYGMWRGILLPNY